MSPNYKRRTYYLGRSFQPRLFGRLFFLIALQAVVITLFFLYEGRGTLTTGYQGDALRIEKTMSFFLVNFVFIAVIVGLAMGIVSILTFLFFSHRIAGPLVNLRASLEGIAAGDLTVRVRLRKKDELKEVAEALNRFTEAMDRQIGRIKKETHEASSQDPAKVQAALGRLKASADSFKTTV